MRDHPGAAAGTAVSILDAAPWRWIPPIRADGATQMAIDAWMLAQLVGHGAGPMLRLYHWSRPTLSLGVHQHRLEPHWSALEAAGRITIVRRPSGGRAVLHDGELTYALACRPGTTRRQEAYRLACQWLQAAFADLGLPLQFGAADPHAAQRRSSCFASGTAADLVHANGAKRIGSAQLWRGQALLQHGSVLLTPSMALWKAVFRELPPPLPPLALAPEQLTQRLRQAAERHLCTGGLQSRPLSREEWRAVATAADPPLKPRPEAPADPGRAP